MELKVGQKVRIHTKKWFEKNLDDFGRDALGLHYNKIMRTDLAGRIVTIASIDYTWYGRNSGHVAIFFREVNWLWNDLSIEVSNKVKQKCSKRWMRLYSLWLGMLEDGFPQSSVIAEWLNSVKYFVRIPTYDWSGTQTHFERHIIELFTDYLNHEICGVEEYNEDVRKWATYLSA